MSLRIVLLTGLLVLGANVSSADESTTESRQGTGDLYEADWTNYAPHGMPDFSQDNALYPSATYCAPTAVANSLWWLDSQLECGIDRATGDASESEFNNSCTEADDLGEVPPLSGFFSPPSGETDAFTFSIPYTRAKPCSVTVSTCARGSPTDADTTMGLRDTCPSQGPSIATNDDGCPDASRIQSEITASVAAGVTYYALLGIGSAGTTVVYTLSLGIDCYSLVERYPLASDDHSEQNPGELVPDLAACMQTDDPLGGGTWKGTRLPDLQACLAQWLSDKGLDQSYAATAVPAPSFQDVANQIEDSGNAILLLGLYWQDDQSNWTRCGGHYVTAAGVDSVAQHIILSDPAMNNAEPPPVGNGAPGRVRGPDHMDHAPSANPAPDHDDAQNVSHDSYVAGPSMIPAGPTPVSNWSIPGYGTAGGPTTCADVERFCFGQDTGQNPQDPPGLHAPCDNLARSISTEVEAMVTVSPVQSNVCVRLTTTVPWPENLRVDKGACGPATTQPITYDVIRGKLCNLRASPVLPAPDLGLVECLYDDSDRDRYDDLSPDDTRSFVAWFYLVRQSADPDYGVAQPSGQPRIPGSGGCP